MCAWLGSEAPESWHFGGASSVGAGGSIPTVVDEYYPSSVLAGAVSEYLSIRAIT